MSVRKYEWTQHIVNPKNVQRMHDCMPDVCVLVCVCVWEGRGRGGGGAGQCLRPLRTNITRSLHLLPTTTVSATTA